MQAAETPAVYVTQTSAPEPFPFSTDTQQIKGFFSLYEVTKLWTIQRKKRTFIKPEIRITVP